MKGFVQKALHPLQNETSVILYFEVLDSIIMGVVCASKETSIPGMVLWILRSLMQCMVIKAFTNMIFVTGFWYSSVLHLKIQLDQLRHQLRFTKESTDKYLTNLHIRNNYKTISDRRVQQDLLIPHPRFNYCSALTNCPLFLRSHENGVLLTFLHCRRMCHCLSVCIPSLNGNSDQ